MTPLFVEDLIAVVPLIIAICGGLGVILLDIFAEPKTSRAYLGAFAAAAFAAMGIWAAFMFGQPAESRFFETIKDDDLSRFMTVLFAAAGVIASLAAMGRQEENQLRGEFYALLLFSSAGAVLIAQAHDLITLFLGIETLSIPAYILAASDRANKKSAEAGFKYFILGAFSSGFLIFGIALLFGASGSFTYQAIAEATSKGWTDSPLLIIGTLMVLFGLLFKVGAVPFHMWVPDVYQGAPTPTTALFATGIKAAALAAMFRLIFTAIPEMAESPIEDKTMGWYPLFQVVAIITMTAANLTALLQTDVKRILAYSSIAHAGYLLLGFLADKQGLSAMLFYLTAYIAMTAGAFIAVMYFEKTTKGTNLTDYKGLGRKAPLTAAAMSLFLFSLAGIPPTAGFFGKFYLFKAAMDQGLTILVVAALINSAIAAFYYLRIMVSMYMEPTTRQEPQEEIKAPTLTAAIILCAAAIPIMGVYPAPVLEAAIKAAACLF